jgi:hypothetical protein
MTQVRGHQPSLSAGELSDDLRARGDIDAYRTGAKILDNLLPRVQGGAEKRAGTRDRGAVPNAANRYRLIPFLRGRDDRYLLELGPLTLRVIDPDTGAYLEDGDGVIELTTPWGADAVAGLSWAQSVDVVYFVSDDSTISTRILQRYAVDDWRLVEFDFEDGPYLPLNGSAVTISASAQQGNVTLTASSALFEGGHVGQRFRLEVSETSLNKAQWGAGVDFPAGSFVQNDGRVYVGQNTAQVTSGRAEPIHDDGVATDGQINWLFYHDGQARVKVTAVASGVSASGTVIGVLPQGGATKYWREPAFSGVTGFPAVVALHQERLWFFNTPAQPDTGHASRVSAYSATGGDFKPTTKFGLTSSDDAIAATFADSEVNPIVWAVSADRLYVASQAAIKQITGPSEREPITPAGRLADEVATTGARKRVRPVKSHDAIVYPSADGREIHELALNAVGTRDLTVRARHVTKSPIAEMALLRYPDKRIILRRDDGALYVLLYERAENIAAFAPIRLGGAFEGGAPVVESLAVMPQADGPDTLWMIVKRTVNGLTTRRRETLERVWSRDEDRVEAQHYADACVIVDRWNADPAIHLTLALAEAGKNRPGDGVTISGTMAAAVSGDELWIRKTSAPARDDDEPGPVRIAMTSPSAGVLLSSAPDGLVGVRTHEWAIAETGVSGLSHLEGEALAVLADGAPDAAELTVSGGAVTLSEPAAYVVAGLPYQARLVSLPIEPGSRLGSSRGVRKMAEQFVLVLKDTIGGRFGQRGRTLDPVGTRRAADPLGRAPGPRTETVSQSIESDYQEELEFEFVHDLPTACTVLGVGVKADFHE